MLEVYRVKDLEYSHEKRQAKELIDLLETYFKIYNNEKQYVVLDPRTDGLPQTEAILYFRGYTIILELKDYIRRIYPKFQQPWEAEDEFGNVQLIKNQGENPFHQIGRQRNKYVKLFAWKVFDQAGPEIPDEVEHKIRKNLSAWIVTARNSTIDESYKEDLWWRKVIPLNHEFNTALYQFGRAPKNSVSEKEFTRFLASIGAVKPPLGYWNTGAAVPELEDSKSYIVEKLLQSSEVDEVIKGLNYSEELKLINNFDLIEATIPRLDDELREKCYRILFAWTKYYPNKFIGKSENILRAALRDENYNIRKIALEYLTLGTKIYGTEMLQFIQERLRSEIYYDNIDLIVKSLEFFDDRLLAYECLEELYINRIYDNYLEFLAEANILIEDREKIVEQRGWIESDSSRARVSEIEKRLKEISGHIEHWDNVIKSIFEVSISLEFWKIGSFAWKQFNVIFETYKGGYERYSSLSNKFKYIVKAIGSLKPDGVSDIFGEILTENVDDYLKYLIVGALGDIGDKKKINVIRPFLDYNDEEGNVSIESMRIQTSDALSKLGDIFSYPKIWKLFVSQKEGKEDRIEGDKSFLKSLRRLDRKRLERDIWKEIGKMKSLEKALATYSNSIRECGGEFSFLKLKEILFEKGDLFSDWWYAPSSTIVSLPWHNPSLQQLSVDTGLQILQHGSKELKHVGLELAESYFLKNLPELEKYENSEDRNVLSLLVYIYSKINNGEKVESFLTNKVRGISGLAFQRLEETKPEQHFGEFHLIRGNHVFDCEFIVLGSGFALRLRNVVNSHFLWQEYIQLIPWSKITGLKSMVKEKSTVGLLFTYDGGGTVTSALVPRNVAQWNYLYKKSMEYNTKMSEIENKILRYVKKNEDLKEVVSTSDFLFNILKKAFMKEQEISYHGDEDYIDYMSKLFDEHFKADMMYLM